MMKRDLELEQRTDRCKYIYHLVYDYTEHKRKIDIDTSKIFKTYDGDTFIYTDRFGEESTITWKEYKKFMINEYGVKRKFGILTVKIPCFEICSIVIKRDGMIPRYLYDEYVVKFDATAAVNTAPGYFYSYPNTYKRMYEVPFEDIRPLRQILRRHKLNSV